MVYVRPYCAFRFAGIYTISRRWQPQSNQYVEPAILEQAVNFAVERWLASSGFFTEDHQIVDSVQVGNSKQSVLFLDDTKGQHRTRLQTEYPPVNQQDILELVDKDPEQLNKYVDELKKHDQQLIKAAETLVRETAINGNITVEYSVNPNPDPAEYGGDEILAEVTAAPPISVR